MQERAATLERRCSNPVASWWYIYFAIYKITNWCFYICWEILRRAWRCREKSTFKRTWDVI